MNRLDANHYQAAVAIPARKIGLIGKSILIGISVGAVTSLYRFVLMKAEALSFAAYAYIRSHPALVPLLFLALCALGYGVGQLASKYKYIGGSGIPQVKGIIMGHFNVPWLSTLVAKFIGGAASILAGLSLGREGPSIQLGACVGEGIANRFAASRTEKRMLIAGGASAGLAAAFNAPLAGAMFAVEEIFKYISPVILLVTMVCAILGDFVSKMIFGVNPFVFLMKDALLAAGIPLQRRLLRRLCAVYHLDLEYGQLELLRAFVSSHSGGAMNLPLQAKAFLSQKRLHIIPDDVESMQVAWQEPERLPTGGDLGDGRREQVMNLDALQGAAMRCAKPGDHIKPLGMTGSQPLKKYLSAKGVDRPFRAFWPVYAIGQRVLWVPGMGIAQEAAVLGPTTARVRLRFLDALPDEINELGGSNHGKPFHCQ